MAEETKEMIILLRKQMENMMRQQEEDRLERQESRKVMQDLVLSMQAGQGSAVHVPSAAAVVRL